MAVFLSVSQGGGVVDVVRAPNFEKAYEKTIRLNNGEFLVEITKQDFQKMSELSGNKERKAIDEIFGHIASDENNPAVGDFHQKANSHIKRILLKYKF